MKVKFIKLIIFNLFLCFISVLVSCDNGGSKNKELIEQKDVNQVNVRKKWIITHFMFTDSCKTNTRLKYQLSSIHLDLKNNRYTAIDQYSLIEDEGSWSLKNSIIELISDKGDYYLKARINTLSNNEMEADVLDHQDLVGVELISIK
ncbi:hypothetical protein [Myroides odoratus]|uniref:Lipocalin-like domain-containing protein n=1 Tax=Myroides odoratus TaxID=256 RepID=A0A9Q6ZD62_MYROD|nr:hypothetical protein [Myroides odoratus]EHQ44248.1 hypothetical protein Myrod_3443 [Myroides odoratus DSM 2801]EKB05857.1 hypothetical protein HMPREF9716_02650 [Myroides odoratus CIP 103059]QQU01530.1 hypothetical protein I6I88_07255 [Myroides odoratus]WQD56201.1 hypothetical protein U0010_11755 [Myroides odoratus]STZ31585.1 Uncharacterised protein [Myroides odoratus]